MSNYKAIIAKIDRVASIPNADRIQTAFVLGEQVIVSKGLEVGHVGVFFCSGTQLSEDFCKYNNLYRESEKNSNPEAKGFFEDSRRVRAQPFLKVKSEGYFANIESLIWTGYDISKLKVGDSFEDLGGVKVCNKYTNPRTKLQGSGNKQKKVTKKKLVPTFVEHMDTGQYNYNKHRIQIGDLISIQSKLHGTSHRSGYLEVDLDINKFKRLVNKIIPVFKEKEFQYITGTRRVILNGSKKEGFHGSDDFRYEVTEALKPHLEQGMTVYGEICGYANGRPIMSSHNTKDLKDKGISKKYGDVITYKYGCLEDQYRFHVYRITMTNEQGFVTEFSQSQLVKWCKDRDILPSHDLIPQFIFDGDFDKLDSLIDNLTERPEVLGEDYHDHSQIGEGVIVRVDSGEMKPIFLKNKNYYFKVMEGIISEIEVDLEDES